MKRQQNIWSYPIRTSIVMFTILTMICACSEELNENHNAASDELQIFIESDGSITRGSYEEAGKVEKYAVYSFRNETKTSHVKNCVMTKTETGTWKKSKILNFPGTGALDFYALKPSFDEADSHVMEAEAKYFTITMPTTNANQKDFMFSSLINKTKAATNNKITFKLKHVFSYLRFLSKLTNENIEVEIHAITLHNLLSTGTFTYDRDKERSGSWAISDEHYADYTFLLPKDSVLKYNEQISLHTNDSLLFVMPQKPAVLWDPEVTQTIAAANADHQAYMSIECRVWRKQSAAEIAANIPKEYVGECSATTWTRVYYPLKAGTAWTSKLTPFSGNYNVIINWTGGYTADGQDFLAANTGEELMMSSIESVETTLATDPWVNDETNSAEIDF